MHWSPTVLFTGESATDKFQQERDAALREIAFHKDKLQKSQHELKEQTPSEQKYSSNPYMTQTRTDFNYMESPEGGVIDHQRSLQHHSNLNSRPGKNEIAWLT